jgi:hypothetical protein
MVEGLYDAEDVAVERFEVGLHFSQAPELQKQYKLRCDIQDSLGKKLNFSSADLKMVLIEKI